MNTNRPYECVAVHYIYKASKRKILFFEPDHFFFDNPSTIHSCYLQLISFSRIFKDLDIYYVNTMGLGGRGRGAALK